MTAASVDRFPAQAWQQVSRIGPLGTVVLLHIGFFLAVQGSLNHAPVKAAAPREVVAVFVTPEPVPAPPQPAPVVPKTVPVIKKPVVKPRPAPKVVNDTPAPKAITAPPPEPEAPAPPPVAAAPAAPPSPPAPPAPVQPRTITSGIEYLQPPRPAYPPLSRRMGEQGLAVLRVLVNDKGRPERVELHTSSGSARLDEAARQAALRAVFKPFVEDGKAVPAFAIVPIRFQLDN